MFRNILAAIDQSETARRALAEAADLAESQHAQLTVITVVAPMPGYAYRATVDLEALEREAEAEAQELVAEAIASLPEGLPVTTVLKLGHPGEQIVNQIEAGAHDLLVIGSRGRGRLVTNVLGSVGAHVHYHTHAAMLVVHPSD